MRADGDRRAFLAGAAGVATAAAAVAWGYRVSPASRPRPSGRERILVVGGGLSGLVAAQGLVARGHDVTVLEAKQRAGGRILTVRAPWRDGLFVEAGATHVVGEPDLLALFAEMGVALEKRPSTPGLAPLARVRYFHRQRVVMPAGAGATESDAFTPEERALGFEGRMKKYLAPATRFDPTLPLPRELAALDRTTGGDYLRWQQASPGFVAHVDAMLGLGDDGIEGMSALGLLQMWAAIRREMRFGPSLRVVGGSDRLPAAIAARLGGRLICGAAVRSVQQDAGGVTVSFERAGVRDTWHGDRAICALPPGPLAAVEFHPALSPAKARALRELGMENVTRVWLQADERFWIQRGHAGRAETDLAIGPVRDETDGMSGTAGILGAYVTRGEARRLAAMDDGARAGTVLDQIELVHPGMRAHCTATASHCWQSDPFQRGAYAYFKPGQLFGLVPHLASPEGRVHFAGDHASYRPGFMHGALTAARRVVAEIADITAGVRE